jgi:NAD+ synthase (glutamine-hydrolysing)
MPWSDRGFFDLYAHDFVRVAVAVPRITLADPAANAKEMAGLHAAAADGGAALVVFPELSLTGYSLDDLHQQEALLRAALGGLGELVEASRRRAALLVAGAPLRFEGRLFNCAVVLSQGRILGIVPKTYLPNYREYYERRQFTPGGLALSSEVECLGQRTPFGPDLLFRCRDHQDFVLHVEVCEDLWAPIPPSTYAALRGATVLANLSASNVTVGKSEVRHQPASGQSARCLAAYVYAAAGPGESTTDLAWEGDGMVYENGDLLVETERFHDAGQLVTADVDLARLVQERMRIHTFTECAGAHRNVLAGLRDVPFSFEPPRGAVALRRVVARHPYVPDDPGRRDDRCYEAYNIQVAGLSQRLRATGIRRVVIGVSGGLDSTQALIVAARVMDRLGLPRSNILAYVMPGFASTRATQENALDLIRAIGATGEVIDIRPSCEQMLRDIGHPYASGKKVYDVTFENVQAGERTSHLFRLANRHEALVVGTSDLSELALGWCTYGVGDQMSHYAVNASVPKTLIRFLIGWVADRDEVGAAASPVLRRILDTASSPELVPGEAADGPAQRTEQAIGPFDLHDFSLYHLTRYGFRPARVAFLAGRAWARDVPGGPADGPYRLEEILQWLGVFLDRFFRTSQFKRSAMPNAPKVGSGGSLSPRGDWRAPSDSTAAAWLADLEAARAWIARSSERAAERDAGRPPAAARRRLAAVPAARARRRR